MPPGIRVSEAGGVAKGFTANINFAWKSTLQKEVQCYPAVNGSLKI
jgi:hypothetical protein